MQPQPAIPPAQAKPRPYLITAQPSSRLADLLSRREQAKARAEEAAAELKSLDAEVKNELTAACASYPVIDIDSPGRSRLRLAWRTKRLFNRKRFERDYPGMIDPYLEWSDGTWELRELKGGSW